MTETSWFEFQNYYMLLFGVPIFLGLFLRTRSNYYIVKSFFERGREAGVPLRAILPRIFFLCALSVITVALADPTRSYTQTTELFGRVRIMLALDNSSSMYNFSTAPGAIYCTNESLERTYPRIYTGCQALYAVINETEKHSKQKTINEKDQIALVRFALYSKVQSYPTSAYDRLRATVNDMNWNAREAIGIYTEIHLALWDLFLLAFERNKTSNTSFTSFMSTDVDTLAQALSPEGSGATLFVSRELEVKLIAMRQELRDTVFILFTDAEKGQLEQRLNKTPVSFEKMIDLAAFLEIPVYIISTDLNNAIFAELVKKTGYGPLEGKHRGDFLAVGHGTAGEYASVEQLIATILESRSSRTIPVVSQRRESYAIPLSVIALTLLIFGLVLRQTTGRSLSEP